MDKKQSLKIGVDFGSATTRVLNSEVHAARPTKLVLSVRDAAGKVTIVSAHSPDAHSTKDNWLRRLHRGVISRVAGGMTSGSGNFDFILFWKNFSYLLPRKTRERVFEPAYQDLLADHLETRRKRGKWVRRWLTFCFAFRTVLMVGDCFRALLADRGLRFLMTLVPEPVKRWWIS